MEAWAAWRGVASNEEIEGGQTPGERFDVAVDRVGRSPFVDEWAILFLWQMLRQGSDSCCTVPVSRVNARAAAHRDGRAGAVPSLRRRVAFLARYGASRSKRAGLRTLGPHSFIGPSVRTHSPVIFSVQQHEIDARLRRNPEARRDIVAMNDET